MPHNMSAGQTSGLAGKRILVLEDDFLISEHLKLILSEAGAAEIVAVHNLESLREAVAKADQDPAKAFDLAILDLRVGRDYVFEDLALFVQRGIAFVFASGVSRSEDIPKEWRKVPLVQKPYFDTEVVETLRRVAGPKP